MTESAQAGPGPAGDRRRRWAVDAGIALAVTAIQIGGTGAGAAWRPHPAAAPGWPVYLLLVLTGLVLVLRRRYPVMVLAVTLGATLVTAATSASGMIWLALIAAFFSAVLEGRRLAAIASLVIGYTASFWPVWQIGRPGHGSVSVALGVAAWLLLLLAAAEFVRFRRERGAELARNRDDQLRRRASEERMRIARNLHDVVAHNISVINVQANTALYLMDRQPERAREALTAIHDVSRQALSELRSVLGVLRSADEGAPRAPSPGLSQLDELVSALGRAGLDVRLQVEGDQAALPADVDLAAYRIVQEALTNTARHSTSRAASVVVLYQAGGVLVQIDDAGPARSDKPARPGNGITGMAERAHALGGRLSAGVRPGGGFRVAAWLPSTRDGVVASAPGPPGVLPQDGSRPAGPAQRPGPPPAASSSS